LKEKAKMTSTILKALALLSAIALPQSAFAQAYTTAAPIAELNPREYGLDIYLPLANNPASCNTVGWFRLKVSAVNYEVLASVLITAAAQKKPILVYTTGCDFDGVSIIIAVKAPIT
jgi:hypothetical protein